MPAPDPKQDHSKATGDNQQSPYGLDRYTVTQKSNNDGGEKSPYYQSAAPSIDLPKGGGALKGIDEKFSVNAVNGTAGVQVALPLSPGRSGFTPNLSLSYNSGSGNSEFGLGWSLGLPAIQRRTDKKLPRYNDGAADEHECDVFIMAGAEDLQPLLIYDSTTHLWKLDTYTDGHYFIKRYRPRIEGLFARIELILNSAEGYSWWKVTTKDNIVTYYGLTAAGRVSDPADDTRVYKWLPEVTFDSKGNIQQYFYVTDSDPSIIPPSLHEQNRKNGTALFTNTYLNNVAYCNLTPYTPSSDYEPVVPATFDGSTTETGLLEYQMLMVMDYGNYDSDVPTPYDDLPIPCRVDPFSDFHAGFEIRTYRRCMRALMFHFFRELTDEQPVLVRSTNFGWNLGPSPSPTDYAEADYIITVTQSGYTQQADGTYFQKSLPAMSMTYNALSWDPTSYNVSPDDMENAPQGLTGPYQWIDLWGEGIPGILTEQAGSWFYKRNLGNGHFAPSLAVAEKPSFQGLGSNMQWQDLDADGRRQLVSRSGALRGYFELDDDQGWQPFQSFNENINVDWSSPYTHMLDLNGDGRPDLLITEDRVWQWYENEGTDGFKEGGFAPTSYNEEKGPLMLHNDMQQVIFLADMNGDGMTDIARIQNGEVCYWPNIGYGKFGARVTMTNSPWFDRQDMFNPQYITLADVSGTGATDIIYIAPEAYRVYVNLAGNAWSEATDIAPMPGTDEFSKISVVDLLGIGTPCLVWSSPLPQHAWAPMRYINLMGGNKPYLMNSYDNGMGKTITLTYKQSTQFYLEDMAANEPWITMLPFPVHCVSQVDTADSVSQTKYTQQYSYHHGYYDHPEREFRGFGRVDTTDADYAKAYQGSVPQDLNQYPVLTKTWYHTGAWMREGTLLAGFALEYFDIGWAELPTSLSVLTVGPTYYPINAQEEREGYRALKGQPLRQEVYSVDGSPLPLQPYTVTTHAYQVQQVQPLATNMYSSFFSYTRESLVYSCERIIADPRVMHELTLGVDVYGNIVRSAKVAYPRLTSPPVPSGVAAVQSVMLCTTTDNKYTNDVLTGGYHLRVPSESTVSEITGLVLTAALWTPGTLLTALGSVAQIDFTVTPTSGIVQSRVISKSRTLYLSDDTSTPLAWGTIESLCIPYQQYQLAFSNNIMGSSAYYGGLVTDAMIAEGGYLREDLIPQFPLPATVTNYWLPGGTATYDTAHFYMPVTFIDPFGKVTTITYWGTGPFYYLLPATVKDAMANITSVLSYNWYNLQPTSIKDPNNNITDVIYDALGMPVALAMRGKGTGTEGDELTGINPDDPTDMGYQDLFFGDPETYAALLLQRATWRCVYDLDILPVAVAMIGREFHYHQSFTPPPSPPDNRLLIRLTYTDGLGREAMSKVQAPPASGTVTRWIGSGKKVYNNKGNVVMQYEPYFTTTPAFDDALFAGGVGVTPRLHYDPLGRVMRTDLADGSYSMTTWDAWTQTVYDNNDTVTSSHWYSQALSSGVPGRVDAATKAAYHNNTPTIIYLDPLARPFYTRQHERIPPAWADVFYDTLEKLDIQGNRRQVVDANNHTPLTYTYNMLKAVVCQVSIDGGTQHMLADVTGQPLYSWDAAGRKFHFAYDDKRRPLTKKVTFGSGSGTTFESEKMVYGESTTSPETNNLRGKLYQVYDGGGMKTMNKYDFKGNVLLALEQLLNDPAIMDVDWTTSVPLSPETFQTTTTYDALNRPMTVVDPGGNTTRYVYNEAGMLYQVYHKPAGGTESGYVTAIKYDAHNRRASISYLNHTSTSYAYDYYTFRLSGITTKSTGGVLLQALSYWYDPVGNITTVEDDAQRAVFFMNSVVLPVMSYTYDALYRLCIANGREKQGTASFGTTDNYNDAPWMGQIIRGDDNGCQNYTENYSYDPVGNIVQLKHNAIVGSYTRNYNYTPGTNRLANTIVGATTYNYGYDTFGNIIHMPHLTGMVWNMHNEFSLAAMGSNQTFYQYSGGQRVRKTTVNGGIMKQRIFLGNYEIYREYSGSTITLERCTVHVADGTGRIAMREYRTIGTDPSPATLVRFVYTNNINTVTLELDESGNIISYEEYHPFGTTAYQETNSAINAVAKRYRFSGKERDDESGFYYHGARYYCPWIARWTAVDPSESKYGGRTPYCYCANSPIIYLDPNGRNEINFYSTKNATEDGTGRHDGTPIITMRIIKKEGPDTFIWHDITNVYKYQQNEAHSWYENPGGKNVFDHVEDKRTVLHPFDSKATSGVTTHYGYWLSDLATYDIPDSDRLTVGKMMSQEKEFSDYMKKYNGTADWEKAGRNSLILDAIAPVYAKSMFGYSVGSIMEGFSQTSLFELAPSARGFAIENMRGGNLPAGFKTIDRFSDGVAVSIKSIDLTLPTYQNSSKLASKLKSDINKLASYTTYTKQGVTISSDMISERVLDVVVQEGKASEMQLNVLKNAVNYGKQLSTNKVNVTITYIK